jgi:hypothetical protein
VYGIPEAAIRDSGYKKAKQEFTEALGAVNQAKTLIDQGRQVGDILETRTKVINEPFDKDQELIDEVQDDFYEDATRYELGMGERKGRKKNAKRLSVHIQRDKMFLKKHRLKPLHLSR